MKSGKGHLVLALLRADDVLRLIIAWMEAELQKETAPLRRHLIIAKERGLLVYLLSDRFTALAAASKRRAALDEFFARDYRGGAFELFGAAHLAGLGLVALVCLAVVLLRRRFSPRGQRAFRWGLAALIYLCEGSWQVWMLATGQWSIQGMLPLWLCSVTSWTMPLLLVFRSYRYYEWAYFMGPLGACMALLTPDLTIYGFPHFRFIEFITLHGAIIIAIVYMTAVEGFRPTWRSLPRVFVITNLYWLFCAWVNRQIGSNYLYTQGKLPTPSLLDVLGPHPWYLLSMEVLGIILCLLMYLPFALRDRKERAEAPA